MALGRDGALDPGEFIGKEPAQVPGVGSAELEHPSPDCLVGNVERTLRQEFLDVPIAQPEMRYSQTDAGSDENVEDLAHLRRLATGTC